MVARAGGTSRSGAGARAVALGLFLVLAAAGCGASDPHEQAARYDHDDGTGLYTWLVEHRPSSIVAWNVPLARLAALLPDTKIGVARGADPCRQTVDAHAALVLVLTRETGGRDRQVALDCGVPLFKDSRALVIAPR